MQRLPPTLRQSEAHLYDITTHVPKDPETLEDLTAKEQQAWERKAQVVVNREDASKDYQMQARRP